jgi:hypothetical protein
MRAADPDEVAWLEFRLSAAQTLSRLLQHQTCELLTDERREAYNRRYPLGPADTVEPDQ